MRRECCPRLPDLQQEKKCLKREIKQCHSLYLWVFWLGRLSSDSWKVILWILERFLSQVKCFLLTHCHLSFLYQGSSESADSLALFFFARSLLRLALNSEHYILIATWVNWQGLPHEVRKLGPGVGSALGAFCGLCDTVKWMRRMSFIEEERK